MQSIVVHYKELALKGRNRPWFARMLVRNLRAALGGLDIGAVRHAMGRLEIDLTPSSPRQEVIDRVARIFGIANFSVANRGPQDVNALGPAILQELGSGTPGAKPPASFRISARRSDKRFPLTSPQIERALGAVVQASTGWRVDLEHPDLEIRVDMLTGVAFYYFEKRPGAGGLPTGTGGRVACLLSGGIDSPVAAYRMMRRGCSVLLVHFHSYPILSHASQEKVREIAALLTKHQLRSRLLLVPFGDLQQRVVVGVPPDLRVVIYRRLMMRIAERLARAWRARALVTGEVVGQVASQTIENLATIGEAASLEVLRPLVGMDKDEIVAEAVRIGTYPISIIPDQDCCQLFTPRHPATRARIEVVRAAEGALPIEEMVTSACDAVAVEDFRFPMIKLSAGRSV